MIYGKRSVQASKQASKHTHARVQGSHTSVGLTQAHPIQGMCCVFRNFVGADSNELGQQRDNLLISCQWYVREGELECVYSMLKIVSMGVVSAVCATYFPYSLLT